MAKIRAFATHGVSLAVLVSLLGALALAPAQAAPTTLRWKFQPGEVLHYESAQTTVTKGKDPSGQEVGQTLTLTLDLTWKVKDVDAQGVASLTQTIDRIRTTATLPFGKFSFDSRENGDATGPAGPLFKMLVGAEFRFKMSAKGEISDIQLADQLTASLKGSNQPAGAQGQFSEAGLKNMLVQMGLVLPEGPISADATWNRKLPIPAGPNGETREIEQVYTYKGPEGGTRSLDSVEMATRFQPITPDPNIPVTIKTQEATGQYQFDNQAGRIKTSRVVEKVDLTGKIQDKEISQSNETVTVMTLQPDKAP